MGKARKRGVSGNPQKRVAVEAAAALPPPPTRSEVFFRQRWVQYVMVFIVIVGALGSVGALLVRVLEPSTDKAWQSLGLFTVLLSALFLYLATYVVEFAANYLGRKQGREQAPMELGKVLQKLVLVVMGLVLIVSGVLSNFTPSPETPIVPAEDPYDSLPLFPNLGEPEKKSR